MNFFKRWEALKALLFNGEDEITIDAVIKGGHKFNIGLSTMK